MGTDSPSTEAHSPSIGAHSPSTGTGTTGTVRRISLMKRTMPTTMTTMPATVMNERVCPKNRNANGAAKRFSLRTSDPPRDAPRRWIDMKLAVRPRRGAINPAAMKKTTPSHANVTGRTSSDTSRAHQSATLAASRPTIIPRITGVFPDLSPIWVKNMLAP